jgi:hypothetical protein
MVYTPKSRIYFSPYENKILNNCLNGYSKLYNRSINSLVSKLKMPRHKIMYWFTNHINRQRFRRLVSSAPVPNSPHFHPLILPSETGSSIKMKLSYILN